jgi:hypothetical protein
MNGTVKRAMRAIDVRIAETQFRTMSAKAILKPDFAGGVGIEKRRRIDAARGSSASL